MAAPLHIEYESLGDPGHPAIVLIMGLGMQLTAWPDALCAALVARGYRVIRFDNRDCGLSGRAPGSKRVNLALAMAAAALHLPVRVPYTLNDMAGDVIGLLDWLGIGRAHIVGASMGGMIAQILAAVAGDHRPRSPPGSAPAIRLRGASSVRRRARSPASATG